MSKAQVTDTGFDADLKKALPRLRVYALSLTHNSDRADDLVQQTAMKALAGRNSFRPGSNFSSWICRIERNEFISELRRIRPTVDIDDVEGSMPSSPPRQENGLVMREFLGAFRKLSVGSRQALLLSELQGYSYAQIARHAGISIGTVKSRVCRGRMALGRLLAPQIAPAPPTFAFGNPTKDNPTTGIVNGDRH